MTVHAIDETLVCPRCATPCEHRDDGDAIWGVCGDCSARWAIAGWARSSREWAERYADTAYRDACAATSAELARLTDVTGGRPS